MDSVQSMASSSSSTSPSSERTSHFSSQTETEMEHSKARHYSQLDYSTSASESLAESNFNDFALLKKDPRWGRFFQDFKSLAVGKKISAGAQAEIYEARLGQHGPFNLVVKVMKGDAPLKTFQEQWPIGMLSARAKSDNRALSVPMCAIKGGTMLHDPRLRGRFAFVMLRRWGDLRLLIDRLMKLERSTPGPFPVDRALHLMYTIAEDMDMLHNSHAIIHRDLKASNVLVWGGFGDDMSLLATSNEVETVESVVADFECSVGVLGTGLWRAPEILEQLKNRVPSSKVQITPASDVYSYGMTCYEIVTGRFPADGLEGEDRISQILQGRRPELPDDLPGFVRDMILACWHSDPSERPTFRDICMALKLKRGLNPVTVVIDNESQIGASIVKVEQWKLLQPLALLEVMQKLMDMNLFILKAFDSESLTQMRGQCFDTYFEGKAVLNDKSITAFGKFRKWKRLDPFREAMMQEMKDMDGFDLGDFASSSPELIMHYFEVTDCEGRKLVNAESIAKITKALSRLAKMKRTDESLGTSIHLNYIKPMHVVEVVAERSAGLLWALSYGLERRNFRVHSAGCWTREGRVECVMYVDGERTSTLLWDLRYDMECLRIFCGLHKIMVHRVAAENPFSHLTRRLHNLKSVDLTLRHSSSNIRVHQRQESKEGVRSSVAVVCLGKPEPLAHVSRTLAAKNYKICRASIEYSGPYAFPRGSVNKSEDIDVGTLGEDDSMKFYKILDIASARGCREGNGQLIVSGPRQELRYDLMRSLRENGLTVTGGEVYLDGKELGAGFLAFPSGSLEFFVTEESTTGAGERSYMEDLLLLNPE